MTSLYDQYHSDKNLNHIYNLINDLIEKNHNNNMIVLTISGIDDIVSKQVSHQIFKYILHKHP